MYRRQREVVLPALFRSAVNGDVDHISQVLEGGDSVNITVRIYVEVQCIIIGEHCTQYYLMFV